MGLLDFNEDDEEHIMIQVHEECILIQRPYIAPVHSSHQLTGQSGQTLDPNLKHMSWPAACWH